MPVRTFCAAEFTALLECLGGIPRMAANWLAEAIVLAEPQIGLKCAVAEHVNSKDMLSLCIQMEDRVRSWLCSKQHIFWLAHHSARSRAR